MPLKIKAIVQLSAFDFAIYGSLEGEVLNVSADTVSKDDGSTWYVCLVSIPSDGITSMSRELQLLHGMQATVNIVSGSKTILKYLRNLLPILKIKHSEKDDPELFEIYINNFFIFAEFKGYRVRNNNFSD